MSLADARCTVLQVPALVSASTITAAGVISGASINADVAASRIVNLGPAPGGSATLTSALVPGLTAGSVLFVQQKSSPGAVVTPVVAGTVASGLGFAVVLTAAANITAGTDFWIYVADF
jgi:hypothetical protein